MHRVPIRVVSDRIQGRGSSACIVTDEEFMIFKKNLLCIYDSFWVSFKIFIIIIGFQQFGYDVAWCGFPCVYSASGSFSLLSL